MKRKTIIVLLIVALTVATFVAVNQNSRADGDYNYAFTGYTYVGASKQSGIEVKLTIDGEEYTAYSEESPDYGRYNIGHYMDKGEFCLKSKVGEGINEKRDAYWGNKEEWGTVQHDLVLYYQGPNCIATD